LLSFLAAGPPPVYVGFGSMASRQSKKISNIVVSALSQSGVRGIIATGWGGLDAEHCPDTIFRTNSVPHDWLFPRVSAVVHHGGAGTTAAGLRAGCPTLVCPIFGDQPFWGKVVHDLGAGPEPIYQKKLTVNKLHDAITQLLYTVSMKEKAMELSAQIRKEDGIAAAIAVIESGQ
jgi:sterol 3beta-glucosyltransferase